MGDKALLPCNITPPSEDDSITLVLWYRSDVKILPIYTVDIRHNREKAKHLTHEVLADRAFFNLSVRPAVLSLDPILETDGAEYRCRVDFRWGRTLTSVINLHVIVPPKKVYIIDSKNQQISGLIGPVEEGSDVRLSCIVEGGKPDPSVHWYRDNVLIDVSTTSIDDSVVRNELLIENIRRNDLNSIYSCNAINNNSSQTSISTFVTFDIYVKPSDVKIISIRRPLSSGRKFDLICRSFGSRPPAQLTWLKDNRLLSKTRETFSDDGNVTTSVLELVPSAEDHGSYLNCRAENLRLANSTIEDQWVLNIFFQPKVNLTLRTSSGKGLVAVGSQLFMECHITANPSVVEVKWLLNGQPLKQDVERDVLIRNASLEIRSARREDQGLYRCYASNLEGKTDSNELRLDIHFSPICREKSNNSIGVAIGETIELECVVEASPASVTFDWTVNRFLLNNHIQHSNQGLTSRLSYKVHNKDDLGTIECSAKNAVGQQRQPCLFTLIAQGPPEGLHECGVSNKTDASFLVECMAGDDGGLNQTFHLDIFDDSERKRLLIELTNQLKPIFAVQGLESGHIFYLSVYAANSKGKSVAKTITSNTLTLSSLSSDAKEESAPFLTDLNPLFGALAALLTAKYGHSSTVQCLSMDWSEMGNNDGLVYSNGSIPGIINNYDNKKNAFNSNTINRLNDKTCNNIDIINIRHDVRQGLRIS
ncbi:unnamed protein product [Medioppia subpectinata]|uniref:Nephrin/kirre n=1 Tax=Medioppia subpectinata TaxID=1979941 RepID=A0A7R9PY38_9ACAR|nr:unnamed protein product [Medioppia subpectinata]CAG2105479.1 unnamed protein product [Medioppia subpectinata]